jgi:hypothetical protein
MKSWLRERLANLGGEVVNLLLDQGETGTVHDRSGGGSGPSRAYLRRMGSRPRFCFPELTDNHCTYIRV